MKEKLNNMLGVLTNLSGKMAQSKVMSSISDAMASSLSIIIIGSFALLIAALDVGPWQKIVTAIPYLTTLCYKITTVTTGMLALYIVTLLVYVYSGKIDLKEKVISSAITAGLFLMITPFDEAGSLPSAWMGTSGIVAALILGIVIPKSIKLMIDHKINISMPASVPKFVTDSFSVLIPAIILFVAAGILNALVSLTPYGDIQNMIFMIIQTPLSKIGLSLPGYLFISALAAFAWWCGIHGNAVFSPMIALLLAADGVNLLATQAGTAPPNTFTYMFYIVTIPGGYGQLLIPALLAVVMCKSKQLKALGKAAVAPAIFCIGEPVLFGYPVIFNALLLIPVLLGTLFNAFFWWLVLTTGLVGRFTGVVLPWTTPPILGAFLSSSTPVRAAVANAVMLVIDLAIWYPFMKAFDNKNVKEEEGK